MARKNDKVHTAVIIGDAEDEAALLALCPDLPQWPQRWQIASGDLAVGEAAVVCALDGGSGAGKSTLAGLIAGTLAGHRGTIHLNGETVVAHHVAGAHTDGDSIIHFPDSDVIHMGDVFFHGVYPFIDLDSGGRRTIYESRYMSVLPVASPDGA